MTVLDTARFAYRAGLCILPVTADGSKRPDVSSWAPYQAARPTVAELRAFDFAHRAGLGMIAGPVSGCRECWDFDDAETFEAYLAAADACGLGDVVRRIRAGYEDETPGGGRRWIVAYPPDVAWCDCELAKRPGRDGEPPEKILIELTTFAILAPSHGGTHPSGRPYQHISGGFDTIASYTADERDALLELARSFDQMGQRTVDPARPRANDGTRPGDRFAARTSWPTLLEPSGWVLVL